MYIKIDLARLILAVLINKDSKKIKNKRAKSILIIKCFKNLINCI